MPNRTACSILEDMRNADKAKNYSYLSGLIEEMQSAANRMEAALEDKRDIRRLSNYRTELKEELLELYKQYVAKCKELKTKPKKREAWLGSRFEDVEAKRKDDKFFVQQGSME